MNFSSLNESIDSKNSADLYEHSESSSNFESAHPTAESLHDSVITVSDVHKSFGATKALNGCFFNAKSGEIHAVIGGNGCGKSTLAKVLAGVLPIDSGHVSVLGIEPSSPKESKEAKIAMVFQEVFVADQASIADNLFVGADGLWTKNYSDAEKRQKSALLMKDLTNLDLDPDEEVGKLPLSIKQWIAIGRALLTDPKVLILDESSAALDKDATDKLFEKLHELKAKGVTILIVTHRIAELIQISDRATVMRNGRTVGVLDKENLTEKNLLSMMTGKEEEQESVIGETIDTALDIPNTVMEVENLVLWPESKPVQFELKKGDIVGVAGLDGQGQNEFVRALAGIEIPTEAKISIKIDKDRPSELKDLESARKHRVSYVSGDRKKEGIFSNLSIFENMLIALYNTKKKAKILSIIDWHSLSSVFESGIQQLSIKIGLKSDKITSLSGGNQQKVLIGRSLSTNPDILILNDPARGIDVEAKRELYGHLYDFSAKGKSVVFMSSELEEFIGLCNKVIIFRHGEIFETFGRNEIDPVKIFEAMFGQKKTSFVDEALLNPENLNEPVQLIAPPIQKIEKPKRENIKILDFEKSSKKSSEHKPAIKIVEY